jgi:hypothetical protein
MQSTAKAKLEQRLVDTAREILEAMPPPPKETKLVTVKEAIKALSPTIAKLLRRGHTREGVVALLKEQGIDCSPATFRSIYRAPKGRTPKATPTAARATPGAAPASNLAAASDDKTDARPNASPFAQTRVATVTGTSGRRGDLGGTPTATKAS